MNLQNIVQEASQKLKDNNIVTYALDAQIILADIMGIKREFLISKAKELCYNKEMKN